MVSDTLFKSDKMDWGTPQAFYDLLDAEFHFTLDACATAENAKCAHYYTKEDDGLSMPWAGHVWCNPPYGRDIGDWVRRAFEASVRGAIVVLLIPARTDTAYWHEYVMRAAEVRFVRGRLTFEGADNSAPFPSAVVVFGPGARRTDRAPIMRAMEREAA